MPTPTKGPRLGGGPAHERLILANLAQALFENDRITTTQAKAKRVRPLAERLVTFAKRGDLHARRRVLAVISDKGVVHRLFTEIAPDVADRQGGYTRITKIASRKGDNAPMAVIELVREPMSAKQATVREAEAATRRTAKSSKRSRTAAAADTAEAKADEAKDARADGEAEASVDAAAEAEQAAEVVDEPTPDSGDAARADAAADRADDEATAAIDESADTESADTKSAPAESAPKKSGAEDGKA